MQLDRKSELLVRVYLVFFGFLIVAALILAKVIKITLVEGDKWTSLGGRNVKWVDVEGERGNIYDMRGNLLATSLPYFDIYLDLVVSSDVLFDDNIDKLAVQLSKHFGQTPREWKSKLVNERLAGKNKKPGSKYFPLFKRVSKEKLELLKTFPIFKEGRYKGGLQWERKNTREKPYKQLCSRTIGLDRKNATKVGLEGTYDKVLDGETQKRLLRWFPGDVWLPVYDPVQNDQKRGGDVVTTLDMRFQDIAHNELLEALEQYNAEAGSVVVMEVKTGAIKSMVNLGRNDDGSYSEKYNYAIGRLSEPGSTFKLISSLAMLQDGMVELDTEINIGGGKKYFYNRLMKDSEVHGKSSISFQEAFELSSNVGMASAAFDGYGKSRDGWKVFHESMKSLGVMNKTGIEIVGEPKPYFKNPSSDSKNKSDAWSGTTVPWMAHGYELEMTPLQILNVYNSVANGGKVMKPYLTHEIIEESGKVKRMYPKSKNKKLVDGPIVEKAQQLLTGVAERGTAKRLKVENTSFAGKTGTTRLNYWKPTSVKEYNASFAGYFPADQPDYSVIVVVYKPKGAYYGSQVAGPVFADIVERMSGIETKMIHEIEEEVSVAKAHSGYKKDYTKLLEFIGIEYTSDNNSNWVDMKSSSAEMAIKPKLIKMKKVPEVKGMGLRDAVYILESLGLIVEIDGMGQVYKQSIKPGTTVGKESIKIYLK